jgi:hypothetical protein
MKTKRKYMTRKGVDIDEISPEPFKYMDAGVEDSDIDDALKQLAIIKAKE